MALKSSKWLMLEARFPRISPLGTLRFSVRGVRTRLACAAGCSAVRSSEFASSAVASSNPVRTTFMNGSLANDLLAHIALRLINREIEQKPSAKSQSPTDAGKEIPGVSARGESRPSPPSLDCECQEPGTQSRVEKATERTIQTKAGTDPVSTGPT